MSQADYQFREAAGHEFGHSILRETPPPRATRAWFGPIPLSMGQSWSWTHKGTSDVMQVRRVRGRCRGLWGRGGAEGCAAGRWWGCGALWGLQGGCGGCCEAFQ